MDVLAEAVAVSEFHGRVAGLHQGETARMPDGLAVKRLATEDGRDAFQVGEPSRWDRGNVHFDSRHHSTAEDAVKDAFRRSAEREDPASIGGKQRLSHWSPTEHNGRDVRVADFTKDGKAVVHPPENPTATRTVDPSELRRRVRPVGAVLGESLHVAEAVPESLDRSPRKNWVEKVGGLPQAIVHMAKDIHDEKSVPISQAIPIAISQAKKLAAKGQAKYVAAVAQWEKMKAQEGEAALIEAIAEGVRRMPVTAVSESVLSYGG